MRYSNLRKLSKVLLLPVLTIFLASSLSSCSSPRTQAVIIYINDSSSETYPVEGNLRIQANGDKEIPSESIAAAIKANKLENEKRSGNYEWREECEDGDECFVFKGVELSKLESEKYFQTGEQLIAEIPVNESNKAVLTILDGERSAEWNFNVSDDGSPIILNLFITEYFVSVTQLDDGFMTFTPAKPVSQNPERTWEFEKLFEKYYENYLQRDNDWITFKLSYRTYSAAMDKASERTCKVFGKNCDGRASYSSIASAYRSAYDKIVTPMLSELSTSSDNPDVTIALLQLEKMAKLNADCYFRTYSAAEDRNTNSYNATSECFSDVRQQESDLKIALKKSNFDLENFMEVGYGGYPRSFE